MLDSEISQDCTVREHANLDRLLLFDFTSFLYNWDLDIRYYTIEIMAKYLENLESLHPQTTSLWPILASEISQIPVQENNDSLVFLLGTCLRRMCWIEYRRDRKADALLALQLAEPFLRAHNLVCNEDLSEYLRLKGIIHRGYGNLTLAKEASSEVLSIANLMEDSYSQVLCQKILSALALSRGNFSDAVSLATAAEDGLRSTNDYSNLIYILLDRTEIAVKGNHDLLGARQFVDQAAEIASLHNGNKGHLRILNNKASIEGAAGDVMAACGYLGEVLEIDLRPAESRGL